MASKLTTAKRQSYTVSDKLRIIQFAEQNGNRAAEREFGVSESSVRLWRKSKENLEKMPRLNWLKRANRGKKAAWSELEIDLLAWITEKRNNGLAILPSLVLLVIFKRKTVPKINNKHGVVVSAQEKGWMNSDQMKVWIEKAWWSRIRGLGRRRSLLVYDAFEAHVTDPVKAAFKWENTDLAVIPGGLTV